MCLVQKQTHISTRIYISAPTLYIFLYSSPEFLYHLCQTTSGAPFRPGIAGFLPLKILVQIRFRCCTNVYQLYQGLAALALPTF